MRKREKLTNDHRRLIGVAIAMAKADGVLDPSEQKLLDYLIEELGLVGEALEEVSEMAKRPPNPEQIARWCVTEADSINIYSMAIRMAEADGRVASEETVLLERLAEVLSLTPAQIESATQAGNEVNQ